MEKGTSDKEILLKQAKKDLDETKLFIKKSKYSLAISKLSSLIPIVEQYEAWAFFAEAKSWLGYCCARMGQIDLVFLHIKEAINTVEKRLSPPYGMEVGIMYNTIGGIHVYPLGLYSEAIVFFEKSAYIFIFLKDYRWLASSYTNIADAYRKKGDHKKGITYAQKALNTYRLADDFREIDLKSIYNNLAVSYSGIRKHDIAYFYFYKVLQIYEQIYEARQNEHFARIYNSLGRCHIAKKEFQIGAKYLYDALDICLEMFGKNHLFTSFIFNSLSVLYQEQNQYEKMLEYAHKSLDSIQQFRKNHPSIVNKYRQIARAFFEQKQYENAEKYAQKALQHAKTPDSKQVIYEFLAEIYFHQKAYGNALQTLRNAIQEGYNLGEDYELYQLPVIQIGKHRLDINLIRLIGRVTHYFYQYYLYETKAERDILIAWKYMQFFGQLFEELRKHHEIEQDSLFAIDQLSFFYEVGVKIAFCLDRQVMSAFQLVEKAKAVMMLSSMQESFAKASSV